MHWECLFIHGMRLLPVIPERNAHFWQNFSTFFSIFQVTIEKWVVLYKKHPTYIV